MHTEAETKHKKEDEKREVLVLVLVLVFVDLLRVFETAQNKTKQNKYCEITRTFVRSRATHLWRHRTLTARVTVIEGSVGKRHEIPEARMLQMCSESESEYCIQYTTQVGRVAASTELRAAHEWLHSNFSK